MMGMFWTSPTLTINLDLTSDTNGGDTLTILLVPMSRSTFLKTGYQGAMHYVGETQTHMETLTTEQFDEGDYSFTIPVKEGQEGVAIFVLFTQPNAETQWKQYIPDAYGKEYYFNVADHTINNFTGDN
tara:strand:- start:1110 stop:1493 length:384 start_codon:yes stop_codon:yes gene_type:complete